MLPRELFIAAEPGDDDCVESCTKSAGLKSVEVKESVEAGEIFAGKRQTAAPTGVLDLRGWGVAE
jgi:hypothetical protein